MISALILALLWQPTAPAGLQGVSVLMQACCDAQSAPGGVAVAIPDFDAAGNVGYTITWVDQNGNPVSQCVPLGSSTF